MTDKIVEWIDLGREPQHEPDPNFPNGTDLDITNSKTPSCFIKLPYPAKRVGMYAIKCLTCGTVAMITTAGRVDDPRSVKLPCTGEDDASDDPTKYATVFN